MKRLFTLLVACSMLTTAAFAQVVFEQDFENGMDPMTLIDNDGLTPAPNVSAYSDAWNVVNPAFGNGTNVAISNSWYSPAGVADDWMITPALEITDINTVVSWVAKSQDPDFPDGYQVLVSTTGNEIADFTNILFEVEEEISEFTDRSASVGNYIGQTIHLAWRNNSSDDFLLLVDDIKVEAIEALNVGAVEVTTFQYHELDSQVDIVTVIENNGAANITSVDVTWTDGTDSYTETVTGIDIANGETYEHTHETPFVPTEAVSYDIDVTLANPNGEADNEDNNSASSVISGVTYRPTKRVVIEESTGTWCQFCPRGHVAMEYMNVTYPETFIGLAVHNEDPMAYAEHDGNAGFSSWPSANADRVILYEGVSVAAFESYYQQLNRVAPIDANVEAKFFEETRELEVNISAEYVTQLSGIDHRVNVVLVEDEVTGTGNGYAQVNAYQGGGLGPLTGAGHDWTTAGNPVPAADMVYQDVSRAILGGYFGTAGIIDADVTAGDVFTETFTYTVPNAYDWENMHAVVMILDNNTGAILNANSATFDLAVNTNQAFANELLDVFPNPSNGNVNVALELKEATDVQMTVYTAMGQLVSTQDLGKLAGEVIIPFDGTKLASGVYSFHLNLGDRVAVKQVVIK